MKKAFCKFTLWIAGWKVINNLDPDLKKFIVTMAPHTSNWDFFIGWLGFGSLGLHSRYLIKKEAFVFPIKGIVKALGGIPVDRKSSTNVVTQVGELFKKESNLIITITPEGTRSLNKNWKRGYYYIAEHAQVPIVTGFLDYKKKIGGMGLTIMPTGDYDADFKKIVAFYEDKTAKYPEKFNLSKQNQDL